MKELIGLAIVVVLVIIGALIMGVTDEETAARILESEGVTSIEWTGYDYLACSKDDWYHTGFKGVKNGHPVSGVVCAGILTKASTVRYH